MDLEQILAFINVASLKSFSEAAEKLFISQPSVSIRIKNLEEELGVVLFDRSKAREPQLTENGRVFLDYAQAMLKLQQDCRERLSGQLEDAAGLVHVGASTVPGTCLLPDLLARLKKTIPAVDFNINILDTSAVLEGVMNYSYDLGFTGQVNRDERLVYLPLIEDELVLCVPQGYFAGADCREGVTVEQLLACHLILREKGSATRRLLENRLAAGGYSEESFPRGTYINSLEGVRQFIRAGLGVAVVSRLSVADLVGTGAVETYTVKDLDLKRSLYLVYHRSRVLGGAAQKTRDFVIKEFT